MMLDAYRGRPSHAAIGDFSAIDLVGDEASFLGSRVRVLDDDEMAVVQMHAQWGDELLAELGYPEHVRRVVRGHHERLDGSGYPDGLSGDAIDLPTRILAVADVYDALVSDRVYRPAWEPQRALALLRQGAGAQFDERCVAALERRLDEKNAQIAGSYQTALDLRWATS